LGVDIFGRTKIEPGHLLDHFGVKGELKWLPMGKVIFGRRVEALGNPRMRHDLTEADTLGGIRLQHFVDQIAAF
jgi:hypothetical protein